MAKKKRKPHRRPSPHDRAVLNAAQSAEHALIDALHAVRDGAKAGIDQKILILTSRAAESSLGVIAQMEELAEGAATRKKVGKMRANANEAMALVFEKILWPGGWLDPGLGDLPRG